MYNGLKEHVERALEHFFAALFPGHLGDGDEQGNLEQGTRELKEALGYVLSVDKVEDYTAQLIRCFPGIRATLETDIIAAYKGDPAAQSVDEVILSYPAFTAIGTYRVAHELYRMRVPLVPRIMTEYAHQLTGIDIHPGAQIGDYFFIDHGTGVVIGETTTIGHHVKLYQNVTIGAKSFKAAPDGSLVKGIKRHPDIGNEVVIYSGATILGGDTVIGDRCVIGGNVWLTCSVEAGSTVLNGLPEQKTERQNERI